jgi:hypothetical protein
MGKKLFAETVNSDYLRGDSRARIGPFATVVNGTSTGKSSLNDWTLVDRMMVANARVVSSLAKCSPMHDGLSVPAGAPASTTGCSAAGGESLPTYRHQG